jgi:hypothetical protein
MKQPLFRYLLLLVFAAGCTPSTYITGSWKNPAAAVKYKSVLIAALTSNTVIKSTLETDMAKALSGSVKTLKSIDEFPPGLSNTDTSKAALISMVRNKKADAILSISILSRETESRYMPGGNPYYPPGFIYYDDFWGYYDHWYPSVYGPGYYEENKVYYIETNLYDSSTQKLVWSAQSKTYSPDELQPFAREFAATIVARLKADGLIAATVQNDL